MQLSSLCAVLRASSSSRYCLYFLLFFFNDTAATEIYTLSLHDALPIFLAREIQGALPAVVGLQHELQRDDHRDRPGHRDRKSTRLNSSHTVISYAVFCLKKKKLTCQNMTTMHTYVWLV